MPNTCSSPGCGRPVYARGLCHPDYQAARYHGTLPAFPISLDCARCGGAFSPGKWYAKFCSRRCSEAERYDRDRRAPRQASCDECGGSMDGVRGGARFCSVGCGQAHRNRRVADALLAGKRQRKPCRGCGVQVPAERKGNALYCSEGCKIRSRRHEAYGLTKPELDRLLDQHEVCAICRSAEWGRKGPCVDHDHETGAVRGILCGNCNQGLGRFKDDSAALRAAADYLERA